MNRLFFSLFIIIWPTIASAELQWDNHGSIGANSEYYPFTVGKNLGQFFEKIRIEGSSEVTSDVFRFRAKPIFDYDPLADSKSDRYWIDAPEAYFQWKPNFSDTVAYDLQMGLNTVTWGVTDAFNPLDIVNPNRYTDPLNPQKIGSPSIIFHINHPVLSIEGIYIPVQRKSVLPGVNSRWLPRDSFESRQIQVAGDGQGFNGPVTILPPDAVTFNYDRDEVVGNALKNNFGARIESHFAGFDLSLVAFEGAAPVPDTQLDLNNAEYEIRGFDPLTLQVISAIRLKPVYYRQFVWGGSLVYGMEQFIFRAEAAFTRIRSHREELPSLSNEYAAELEHDFPLGKGKLTGIIEGTYAQHPEAPNASSASLPRVFDQAAIVIARYEPVEKTTITASLLYDTRYKGKLARLDYTESLSDQWKISCTADYLSGPKSTPVGTYDKNSRLIFGLTYML